MFVHPKTDEELVKETLDGKLESYELLVRRYQKKIFHFALGYLHDDHLAEDAAQEAFVRAFENLRQLKVDKPFKPWFYQITKNYCFDCLRQKSRFLPLTEEIPFEEHQTALEKIIQTDEHHRLRSALSKLPVIYRQVILGYYFANLSYVYLARSLAVPVNTVRTRLRRGKVFLAKTMKR